VPYTGAALATLLSTITAAAFLPETKFVALPDTLGEATHRDELYKEDDELDAEAAETNGLNEQSH